MEHGIRVEYFVFGYLPVLGKKGDLVAGEDLSCYSPRNSHNRRISLELLAVIFWNNCFFNKYKGGFHWAKKKKKIDMLQQLSLSNPTIHYETAKEEPQTADDVIFFQ